MESSVSRVYKFINSVKVTNTGKKRQKVSLFRVHSFFVTKQHNKISRSCPFFNKEQPQYSTEE